MSSPPTRDEVYLVARKATNVFRVQGLSCCLFGSAGCSLIGCTRTPNDVDIIVMSNEYTTEYLKELLVNNGKGFYKRASKKIDATYTVLYCRLSGYKRSCKVDILIPGILNIPFIASNRIEIIDGFPVLPLFPLLLMKLQGWSDHRASSRSDMQLKQYVDARDLVELVAIAARRGEHVDDGRWLPTSFLELATTRVAAFVEAHRQPTNWRRIGFDV